MQPARRLSFTFGGGRRVAAMGADPARGDPAMWAVLFLGLGVPAGADPKPGDDGTPEYARAAELVRRLGDRRYAVRERAARQLFEMGHAAVAALRTGVRADDEEVRARSAALVPRVTAAGWKRRADAYLARPDGPHDLPLLASWDKLVGGPCLLYTSPSPRDGLLSRMPSSA